MISAHLLVSPARAVLASDPTGERTLSGPHNIHVPKSIEVVNEAKLKER
jgi:hypothetical protein